MSWSWLRCLCPVSGRTSARRHFRMSIDDPDYRRQEAALVREIDRLRSLLRQAGIDAEAISLEIGEIERRHARDIESARAKTQTARADADELRHRLKNTLAVVQAIANATLRSDVAIKDARAAFSSRLEALANAHDILFEFALGQRRLAKGGRWHSGPVYEKRSEPDPRAGTRRKAQCKAGTCPWPGIA